MSPTPIDQCSGMIKNRHTLVVITPVYEDVEASSCLFEELARHFGHEVFLIAVDDGSLKQPLEISQLQRARLDGVVLTLRRNVGHQRAIAIGLSYASVHIHPNQQVVVMDSDGEDMPSTIDQLLTHLRSDSIDVVVAQRKNRVETMSFKVFYALYKRLFPLLTGRTIGFGNFMALNSQAVRRLVSMQELAIHVAASVLASKLRVYPCPMDRGRRYAGQSKMNFVSLILHGFKGMMVFAEDVLVRVGIAAAGIATLSILGAVVATVLKFIGFATPGWFSVALGILMLIFLQTGALALMTLMLTGVVRGGAVQTTIAYQDFIERVTETTSTTLPKSS